MASISQSQSPIHYTMRAMLGNPPQQPLDFSSPTPPGGQALNLDFTTSTLSSAQPVNQPQEILDLCVRRTEPVCVKSEPVTHPVTQDTVVRLPLPQESVIQQPITILQHHLMQQTSMLPLTSLPREETSKNAPSSPDYCSTGSDSSNQRISPLHHRTTPPNMGMIVSGLQQYPMMPSMPQILNNTRNKVTRPFKAYPKDPLTLSVGVSSADSFLGNGSNEAYTEFRRRMLEQVHASGGGSSGGSKSRSNMKRSVSPEPPSSSDLFNLNGSPEEGKDAAYWERRRKNNEAAKRSRDARRHKEDEIAIRAAFLEQENMKLKYELAALRNETAKLRCLLYNS